MDKEIDRSLLEAYSRGEMSRREIGDRMQMEIGFGDHCTPMNFRCRASPPIRTRWE
jgi:hypothetical protein